ncbi:peroxisome proliferator-activated receptor gamma coactivator 1-beta [Xenopus laevis]|uniref:Peroxisome proliferator-activated receptor gamma coactivator 1-beta n=2 Tax=Xenopus laevis TaxID=8355 RepID=A0A1L8GV64_XENLA|nr:peroxisome proliferator-activated receptor gamma coactivator 1-beta [Xenopus laevis]OCT87706.1 hypothetical protein XELAEV_18021404mg [Xenopus laevis]
MADCSALLDEELESFVFNYLTDSPEPGAEPLSLDFPEIDLSQLDASDFDSNTCFNELQWYNDHSENDSSQYSTDDSELLQIIDSENEALLAALTQTLDDIHDDDISLSAFVSSGDDNVCPLPVLSLKPSLAELPMSPESEDELSILKKLLLSPAQTPIAADTQKDGNTRRQGTSKFHPQRANSKVESPTDRPSGFPQAQNRSCTELHRHLVSTPCVPQATSFSKDNNQDCNKEEDSESNEEEEHSEGDPLGTLLTPPPEEQKPQFTCEKEKRAVVDLIRYMHTYCLPVKKHLGSEKHQNSNSLIKRSQLESKPQTNSCPNQGKQLDSRSARVSCPVASKYKWTKPTRARFSILKELLAKDICGDVSKPYRLAQPVYAAFSDACGTNLTKGDTKKDESDLWKPANTAQENLIVKTSQKQENSIYAVRRSSRLNPLFSDWFFDDETSPVICVAQATADCDFLSAAEDICLTTESFRDEGEVAEVEVGQLLDPLDKFLQERDLDEAQIDSVIEQLQPRDNSSCPLPSRNDSAFESRNFEQALTVELCGTAGLTPPTTPPYKPTEEDLYKPEPSHCKMQVTEQHRAINKKTAKKHPERTELFAYLSRTAGPPAQAESQGTKRPFSRSFGDHDYCQVRKVETTFQRKIIRSLDLPSCVETKPKQTFLPVQQQSAGKNKEGTLKGDSKLLKDHEIRASLTKHFGFPDHNLKDESNALFNSPEYDSVFDDSGSECSSPVEDDVCFSPLRSKICLERDSSSKPNRQCYPLKRASPRSFYHTSRDRPRVFRHERDECQGSRQPSQRQIQRKREKAVGEGRMIYIRNLSNSISANELKRRFEVFGEITECRVLSKSRGEKYGFITYRRSEHAALSLQKGASLRKRSEPPFHLSYGGLRHFFWTKYTDLDSNAVEPSSTVKKSKYESMDFDSLLKEAQRSLHR